MKRLTQPTARRTARDRQERNHRLTMWVAVLAIAGIALGAVFAYGTDAGAKPVAEPTSKAVATDVPAVIASSEPAVVTTTESVRVIEHGHVERKDPTLDEGEKVVVTEGVDGKETTSVIVTTVGAVEVSRDYEVKVSMPARDEVVSVGTKREVPQVSNAGENRALGRSMAESMYGWTGEQWKCLNALWTRESGWRHTAGNKSSGAYGIPQSLPGSKMAKKGSDWRTNPATQIEWGLGYIKGRYGTPCKAWDHSERRGWY